jgi:hypothetical protein
MFPTIIQIVVSILVLSFLVWVLVGFIKAMCSDALDQLKVLSNKYDEQIKGAKKRSPWFYSVFVFVSSGVLIIADKSYGENDLVTVVMSLLLLGLFYLSNVWTRSREKTYRIIGHFTFWLAILGLPISAFAFIGWNFDPIISYWKQLGLQLQIALVIMALSYFALIPVYYRRAWNLQTTDYID